MIYAFIQREAAAVLGLRRGALPPLDVPLTNLGLDSLMAVNLRNRMRSALGQELPLRFVIEQPTVRSLADALDTILWTMQEPSGSENAGLEKTGQEHDSFEQDEIRI